MIPLFEYAGMVAKRDVPNAARYGWLAPKWAQLIEVRQEDIRRCVLGYRNDRSAEVLSGWDEHSEAVDSLPKFRAAVAHWADGVPWEETGVYDYILRLAAERGSYDGCQTREDVLRRYEGIDVMFERVRSDRRLLTQRELRGRRSFRELGGVRIHIASDGEPVFGGAGQHRLAIARVLDLATIPAQIGVVHPDALREGGRRRF